MDLEVHNDDGSPTKIRCQIVAARSSAISPAEVSISSRLPGVCEGLEPGPGRQETAGSFSHNLLQELEHVWHVLISGI